MHHSGIVNNQHIAGLPIYLHRLTTGDTLDHTITKITYDTLGPVDQTIAFVGDAGGRGTLSTSSEPIDAALADELQAQFEGDPDIKSFMPMLTVDVTAISFERQLSEPSVVLTGLDFERVEAVGGIQRPDGTTVDLSEIGPGTVILSESLADVRCCWELSSTPCTTARSPCAKLFATVAPLRPATPPAAAWVVMAERCRSPAGPTMRPLVASEADLSARAA